MNSATYSFIIELLGLSKEKGGGKNKTGSIMFQNEDNTKFSSEQIYPFRSKFKV